MVAAISPSPPRARPSRSSKTAPPCGYTFDGRRCAKRGPHRCTPRVAHVIGFFTDVLVHTKGRYARQPFIPAPWQRRRILEPLFGDVVYSPEERRYLRRYSTLYLLIGRKNGKTELVAGIMLYLLVADGEESPELYGLALDKDQARLAYRVMLRMVALSPVLKARLAPKASADELADPASAGIFKVIAADDEGALGLNPSGFYIDELLTQPDRDAYDALRLGAGSRSQPVFILAGTADADPYSFAAAERRWSEKVAADPDLEPGRLVVIYAAPRTADWRKRSTWRLANPALGDFLAVKVLEAECAKAQLNPAEERAFRQFRLNQPPRDAGTKAITLDQWDRLDVVDAGGPPGAEAALEGLRAWAGVDLASTQDLAAVAYAIDYDGAPLLLWRHWTPEAMLDRLAHRTAGLAEVWADEGWLTVTEGDVIDYNVIRAQLVADADRFDLLELAFDPWGMTQLAAELAADGLTLIEHRQGFASMAAPTKELLRLVVGAKLLTVGDPVARWEATNVILSADPAGNLKPNKARSIDKIDGYVAATMAIARYQIGAAKPARRSAYARRDLVVM